MDMLTSILIMFGIYCSFKLGQMSQRRMLADNTINAVLNKIKFPACVAEKIDGHYYLYEKDTTNFLCQASSLEEIPARLMENKKISLAVLMCPEESTQVFWCVNGKLKTGNP